MRARAGTGTHVCNSDGTITSATCAPVEPLRCYAARYSDLLRVYCGGNLEQCNWPGLAGHWVTNGMREGRFFGCPVGGLLWVGCFDNSGAVRIGGHKNDQSIDDCSTRALSLMGYPQDGIPTGFGMEYPQGFAQAGLAQCVTLSTVPPALTRVADAECEVETYNGFRLGGAIRLAVYLNPPPPPSFNVVGPCTAYGNCVRSPYYPSEYGNGQSCTITPTSLAVGQLLSATTFNTESGYDKLIVNGATYSGTIGPSNVLLRSASFTWSSDYSVTRAGWEV